MGSVVLSPQHCKKFRIIYLGVPQHYFPKYKPCVEKIIQSVRIL
jgi:hypothetical protein